MSNLNNSTIAENVKNHMRRLGMKQAPLAKAIGVSQQQLSNLLNGRRAWTMPRLHQVAVALGLSVKAARSEYSALRNGSIDNRVHGRRVPKNQG